MMKQKYGQAKRIWVLDRGMISQDNLDFLRQRNAGHIVGTPKASSKSSRLNCSTQKIGRQCSPAWKSNGWPIPIVAPANNTFFAVPARAARRKPP